MRIRKEPELLPDLHYRHRPDEDGHRHSPRVGFPSIYRSTPTARRPSSEHFYHKEGNGTYSPQ